MIKKTITLQHDMAFKFMCTICLQLPLKLMKCSNCYGILCYQCAKNIKTNPRTQKIMCPYGCFGRVNFQIDKLNAQEYFLFNCYAIDCNICNQNVSILQFRKHIFECKQNYLMLEIHSNIDSNQFNIDKCQYCGRKYEKRQYKCQECNFNPNNTQLVEDRITTQITSQCIYCFQMISLYDFQNHYHNCQEITLKCELCEHNILRKNYNNHLKSCVSQQVQQDQSYNRIVRFLTFIRGHQHEACLKKMLKAKKQNNEIQTRIN